MRKFLFNIAIYSTIILIILGIGELIVRNMPSSYRYKSEWMSNNGSKVETLILGSSHTYYGVKSEIMGDSTFNLANVSQTPAIDLMLLEHYADSLINLKRVIIPISYFTFVDPPLEKSSEWFRIIDYKIQMGITDHSNFSKYNFEISDLDRYASKIKSLFAKVRKNDCDSLGNGLGFTLATRDSDWRDKVKERIKGTTLTMDKNTAYNTEKDLRNIIKFCKARNIECILITTPVWQTYYAQMDMLQLNDMYSRVHSITNDLNVKYIDYIHASQFLEEDFHDVDHLSDKGAVKLTQDLLSHLTIAE